MDREVRSRKRLLRREIKACILGMDPADRLRQQAALVEAFGSLPGLDRADLVLLYASAFPEEIDTAPLIRAVLDRGQRPALPRVDPATRSMTLHLAGGPGDPLGRGVLGIPEPTPESPRVDPAAIDWVLVPGLAFDRSGYRLGRGAGHYDRLLAALRPDALAWALAFDVQIVEHVPTEEHDRPLDGVAGPDGRMLGARSIRPV